MAWILGASTNSSPSIGLRPTVAGASGGFLTLHFTGVLDPGLAKLDLDSSGAAVAHRRPHICGAVAVVYDDFCHGPCTPQVSVR